MASAVACCNSTMGLLRTSTPMPDGDFDLIDELALCRIGAERREPSPTGPMPACAAQAQCNNRFIVIAEPSVGPESPSVTVPFNA